MFIICKKFELCCSHRLYDYELSDIENVEIFGKCSNKPSHGHNYIVEVYVKSKILKNGMVENFTKIKEIFYPLIFNVFDHHYLNNIMEDLPTAENMAKLFFDILVEHIEGLYKIRVYETSTCFAEYTGD